MELNDLLLILSLQTFVLLIVIWFLRYSNKKLLHGIVELEKEVKQVNDFLNRLSESQKRLRHKIETTQDLGHSFDNQKPIPEKETKKEEAELKAQIRNHNKQSL